MTQNEIEQPVRYGPHSPFDLDARQTIERIYVRVLECGRPDAKDLALAIRRQMVCLEWLGEVLSAYPSPLGQQTLGHRHRELQTLVDALSRISPSTFEFHMPTRALLGRALVMAESNFYRLLRHVCLDTLCDESGRSLYEQASRRLRVCLYTKLAEEVLSAIATDAQQEHSTRSKAVVALAQIWEQRLTFRVSEFFPILEATWEARQRFTATGGTLSGTQEIFELFQAGCDPRFVEYFGRPTHGEDEIEAFREFLFGASTEELDRLAREMAARGEYSILLSDRVDTSDLDAATVLYEHFGSRHLQSTARRVANVPGPKHTAEAYIMIHYLSTVL
ncbi:MAG: hypothetical protein RBU21_20500 [FCB group bacterium]|jgi:hypothetical protein|nr:hypothetical protein [FCB group bacterium]